MTSSIGTKRWLPTADEAAEGRRHLDPREVLGAGLGVAYDDREVERQPGDVGERVGGVDGQGGEDREDPVLEELLADLLLLAVELGPADDLDALAAQLGQQVDQRPRVPLHQRAAARSTACSSCSRGISPLAARTATPAAMRRLRPATRTMKNSSRLLAKIARKRARSSSGRVGVLGELEDPLVEAEPGDLPVDEAVLVLLDARDGLGVGLRRAARRRRCRWGVRRARRPALHPPTGRQRW